MDQTSTIQCDKYTVTALVARVKLNTCWRKLGMVGQYDFCCVMMNAQNIRDAIKVIFVFIILHHAPAVQSLCPALSLIYIQILLPTQPLHSSISAYSSVSLFFFCYLSLFYPAQTFLTSSILFTTKASPLALHLLLFHHVPAALFLCFLPCAFHHPDTICHSSFPSASDSAQHM